MSREFGASPFNLFAPSTLGNDAHTVYTAVAGVGEFIVPMVERYTITEVGVEANLVANLPGSGFKCKFVRRMGGVRGTDVSTAFLPAALGSQLVLNTIVAGVSPNIGGVPSQVSQAVVTGELDMILYTAPQQTETGLALTAIVTRAGAVPTTFAGFTATTTGGTLAPQILPASNAFAAAGTSGSEITNTVPNLLGGTSLRAYCEAPFNKGDYLVCKITGDGGATKTVTIYAKGWPGGAAWIEPTDVDSN